MIPMKNLLLLILLTGAMALSAQVNIVEGPKSMTQGTNNAFTFTLAETPKNVAQSQWNQYMKGFKGKTKSSKAETFSDNARLAELSDNTTDVYAQFLEMGDDNATEVTVWFDLGGAYASSSAHADKMEAVNRYLEDYIKKVNSFNAGEYLKMQEKSLKDLEKEWTRLLKDKENYQKRIEDAKKEIAKNEQLIIDNDLAQKAKVTEIDNQKVAVEKAKTALKKVQ